MSGAGNALMGGGQGAPAAEAPDGGGDGGTPSNGLAMALPKPSPGAPGPGSSAKPGPTTGPLEAAHSQAKSLFDATSSALARMSRVRSSLDKLTSMGTAVTVDDVVKAAGKLVAGGADPAGLAGLLADMPENGGDALAAWVASHDQAATAKAAQLAQVHEQARQGLTVASLHLLANHANQSAEAAPSQGPMPGMAPSLMSGNSPTSNALQ